MRRTAAIARRRAAPSTTLHGWLLRPSSAREIVEGVCRLAGLARAPRPRGLPARPGHRRSRALLVTSALAGLLGLSVLVSGCGGSSGPGVAAVGAASTSATAAAASDSGASGTSRNLNAALAFARCMRSHGVPNFPDPDSRGNFSPLTQHALGVSKQTSSAADGACRHLLSTGGTATPEQRQQKFAFALKVARCLRSHGYPQIPDPTAGRGQELPPAVDPSSPRFQAAETACEKQARKALGLP